MFPVLRFALVVAVAGWLDGCASPTSDDPIRSGRRLLRTPGPPAPFDATAAVAPGTLAEQLRLAPPVQPAVSPGELNPGPVGSAPDDDQWEQASKFQFNVLPRSLQISPDIVVSVVTEVTEEGTVFSPPSPERPVYYSYASAPYVSGTYSGTPPGRVVGDRAVIGALTAAGYQRPPADVDPELAIVVSWGELDNPVSAASFSAGADLFHGSLVLRRRIAMGNRTFVLRSGKSRAFDELLSGDLYFVIVSAYDYVALARGQRRLIWRTRIVLDGSHLSPDETVRPMAFSAVPFFGRPTNTVELVPRRIHRWGRVEIGEPTLVELDVPGAAARK